MAEFDTTDLFEPIVAEDVLHTNGQTWLVRKRCSVVVDQITDLEGDPLPSDNWRLVYVGARGDAVFARRLVEGEELWIAQLRHLCYTDENGQDVITNDVMRTSQGSLDERTDGELVFSTKRTRYVFRIVGECD